MTRKNNSLHSVPEMDWYSPSLKPIYIGFLQRFVEWNIDYDNSKLNVDVSERKVPSLTYILLLTHHLHLHLFNR